MNRLEWSNINLELVKNNGWIRPSAEIIERQILRNVAGFVTTGQLLAIMGPTGCGKSSLMNALAGKITFRRNIRLSGQIIYNGKLMDHGIFFDDSYSQHNSQTSSRQSIGYVAQDERLFAFLTVRETLLLASYFHIPSNSVSSFNLDSANTTNHPLTRQDHDLMVDTIMRELSLVPAANTIIGNDMRRGVSGGEYRRVLIGKEMIKNPQLLFLDEPTSGLDSFQALSVMETMKSLTQHHGRIVITVIHQPRSSIFSLFDRLLLLSEGQVIYFGPTTAALNYFKDLGYECPSHYNPADYYLDILSIDMKSSEKEISSRDRLEYFIRHWRNHLLLASYQGRMEGNSLHESTNGMINKPYGPTRPCTMCFSDFKVLMWRSFANVYRNYGALVIRGVTSILFAILVALIYRNLGYQQKDIQNRSGLLYFVIINQGFSPLIVTLTVFSSEKLIVNREVMAGSYQFYSYYFGRILADIPFQLLIALIYCTIVYWTTGLYPAIDRFFIFVVVIMLATLNAAALGYLVSSFSPNEQVANAVGPPVFIILLLYGGFYINASSLPVGSAWVRNLSLVYWGFQALIVNEFSGTKFECDVGPGAVNRCITHGSSVISSFAFQNSSILVCISALIALTIGFIIMGYFCLIVSKQRYCKITPSLSSDMFTVVEGAKHEMKDAVSQKMEDV